jgi:hypothetical protein
VANVFNHLRRFLVPVRKMGGKEEPESRRPRGRSPAEVLIALEKYPPPYGY